MFHVKQAVKGGSWSHHEVDHGLVFHVKLFDA